MFYILKYCVPLNMKRIYLKELIKFMNDVTFDQTHRNDVFDFKFKMKIKDMSFVDIEPFLIESKIPYIRIRHILMECGYGSSQKEALTS